MSYPHIMIDTETLGTTPGSAILSIGAVTFGYENIPNAEFYVELSQGSSFDIGLTADEGTLQWWEEQKEKAPSAYTTFSNTLGPGVVGVLPVAIALGRFAEWVITHTDPDTRLWAKGQSFDFPILAAAYRAVGLRELPWRYWRERDMRTIMELPFADKTKKAVAHNALQDARDQTKKVQSVLTKLAGATHGN